MRLLTKTRLMLWLSLKMPLPSLMLLLPLPRLLLLVMRPMRSPLEALLPLLLPRQSFRLNLNSTNLFPLSL